MWPCRHACRCVHFYPRPPRGGRPGAGRQSWLQGYFYPRPPRGGRRRCHRCPAHGWQISIHALREEGDAAAQKLQLPAGRFLSTPSARRATRPDCPGKLVHRISIHALREEGDKDAQNEYSKGGTFLSTPSARRATRVVQDKGSGVQDFYPRPPRGGRRRRRCAG